MGGRADGLTAQEVRGIAEGLSVTQERDALHHFLHSWFPLPSSFAPAVLCRVVTCRVVLRRGILSAFVPLQNAFSRASEDVQHSFLAFLQRQTASDQGIRYLVMSEAPRRLMVSQPLREAWYISIRPLLH